ncbi:cytidylyltransferase domain-containing protein [Microbacterium sp. R86528]|uniref:acylneuraminate cytidylyltransferase family protein n=1 Tax=Microbacterium sp. R86528 TaxID=3093864 RepID=UPI0037C9D105
MSETVAVIPARGGSKGIERKNLRRVGGIPLVARAILAAQRCTEIDRVVVSTDNDEIADVAREWGADVVMRPADIAGDEASSESALLHALAELEARGIGVQILAFLQATSPFIDSTSLAEAVRVVSSRRRDVAFSAVESFAFMLAPRRWRLRCGPGPRRRLTPEATGSGGALPRDRSVLRHARARIRRGRPSLLRQHRHHRSA